MPKADRVERCVGRSGCGRVVENLGDAMELGFRHIASDASRQCNDHADAYGLQYHLSGIVSFDPAVDSLCRDEIDEASLLDI